MLTDDKLFSMNAINRTEQLGDLAATLNFTKKYSIAKNYGVNRVPSVLKITGIYKPQFENKPVLFTITLTPQQYSSEDAYRAQELTYSEARQAIMKLMDNEGVSIEEIDTDYYSES